MGTRLNRRAFFGGLGAAAGAATLAPLTAQSALGDEADAAFDPTPYFGAKPGYAQLSRNENAYGPSSKAIAAAAAATAHGGAYYDNGGVPRLMAMIAERHGLEVGTFQEPGNIHVTTGSGEVLSAIAMAWGREGAILASDLFWDTTALFAERHGAKIIRVPNGAGLSQDLDALKAALTDEVSLVHIVNPNNPTGELLDGDTLRAFVKEVSQKTTVLVDEAYCELAPDPDYTSMVDLVREGYDVIVARTFSKIYGMAGLRVGYAIASPENIARIRTFAMTWPNVAGVAAALACYEDAEFMAYSKGKIEDARQVISDAVKANGLTHLPTTTNFMFVDLGERNAEAFRKAMLEQKVMIRGIYRTYTNWSRVSMGKMDDVKRYVAALPSALEAT